MERDRVSSATGPPSTATPLSSCRVSPGVVQVSAGAYHSLALRSDGTIWAWGWNGVGQLGDGTTVDRLRPVQVAGLRSATAISAGALHSMAVAVGRRAADRRCVDVGLERDGPVRPAERRRARHAVASPDLAQPADRHRRRRLPQRHHRRRRRAAHLGLERHRPAGERYDEPRPSWSRSRRSPTPCRSPPAAATPWPPTPPGARGRGVGTPWVSSETARRPTGTVPTLVPGVDGAVALSGGWYHSMGAVSTD